MYSAEYIANKLQERKEKVVFAFLLALQKRKELDLLVIQNRVCLLQRDYYERPGRFVNCSRTRSPAIAWPTRYEVMCEYRNTRDALKTVGCFADEYITPYPNDITDQAYYDSWLRLLEGGEELLSVVDGDKSSPAWQKFQEKVAELERNGAAAGLEPEPLPEQVANMLAERTLQLQQAIIWERDQSRQALAEMSQLFNAQLESMKLSFLEQIDRLRPAAVEPVVPATAPVPVPAPVPAPEAPASAPPAVAPRRSARLAAKAAKS